MLHSFRLLATAVFCFCAVFSFAQKRQYTMAEAVNGLSTTLAPKGVKNAQWRPGTHEFYYYSADGARLQMYNAATGDTAIEPWIKDSGYMRTPNWKWLGKDAYYISEGGGYTVGYLAKPNRYSPNKAPHGSATAFSANGNNLIAEPHTGAIAFTKGGRLTYVSKYNRSRTHFGEDSSNAVVYGSAVHRNEFGIEGGIFFSPGGSALAFYRMDQSMVEDYPVLDWSVVPAKVTTVKYPMAGRKSHEVTLQIYRPYIDDTVTVQTGGPRDHYLTCVTWSPDAKYIYIALLNREQNHLWLNQYDATAGTKLRTVLEETDDNYVEPQHPLQFLPGSTTQAIWWSQRDGYMHLWLCDLATNKMRCLTPGDYVVNELIGFCPRTKEVLLTSAKHRPQGKHGYAVNWETGKMRDIDEEVGTHNFIASDDGEYLFDVFSEAGTPKMSLVRSVNGKVVRVLENSANPLATYERPEIIRHDLVAADDKTTLYGNLILPTNFNEKKKYPVIIYLYNGPHVQLVKNSFPASGNLWYEYMAQHGYIVWVMDGRGSANRGQKFEQATFRRLGTVEMEDQLQGVKFLKSLPYVDSTRMGVHGWSFGGFMATSLMLRHPGVFKCAVAGGPVMDWSMYEIMYGERYMDTPEENPKGYKESALYDKVKALRGKLLLIHGAQDATVVWQHSINFLKAAVDAGKQVDYFVYPGYEHNVRGKDRVHLMQKITDYFDENL